MPSAIIRSAAVSVLASVPSGVLCAGGAPLPWQSVIQKIHGDIFLTVHAELLFPPILYCANLLQNTVTADNLDDKNFMSGLFIR